MRVRALTLLLAAGVATVPALAHADTYTTFTLTSVGLDEYSGNPVSPIGTQDGTISGTVTFDITSDMFSGASLTGTLNGSGFLYNDGSVANPTNSSYNGSQQADSLSNGTGSFTWTVLGPQAITRGGTVIPYPTTAGDFYFMFDSNDNVCTLVNTCPGDQASFIIPYSGNPVYLGDVSSGGNTGNGGNNGNGGNPSPTPEPSSLALLGTGLAAAGLWMRRRTLRA